MTRPKWDEYFMIIADAVSLRMSCDRARIGAVIVSADRHILSTGYGGAPSGMPSCDEVGHDLVEINGRQSCVRTVHAEKNAIIYAARHGVRIDGATVYTTASTCMDCAMACIQAGIKRVVYAAEYTSARSGGKDVLAMLRAAGVTTQHQPLAQRISMSLMSVEQLTGYITQLLRWRATDEDRVRGYVAFNDGVCWDVPKPAATLDAADEPAPLGLTPLPYREEEKRGSHYHPAQFSHALINPEEVLESLAKDADARKDPEGAEAWRSVHDHFRKLRNAFDEARSKQKWR